MDNDTEYITFNGQKLLEKGSGKKCLHPYLNGNQISEIPQTKDKLLIIDIHNVGDLADQLEPLKLYFGKTVFVDKKTTVQFPTLEKLCQKMKIPNESPQQVFKDTLNLLAMEYDIIFLSWVGGNETTQQSIINTSKDHPNFPVIMCQCKRLRGSARRNDDTLTQKFGKQYVYRQLAPYYKEVIFVDDGKDWCFLVDKEITHLKYDNHYVIKINAPSRGNEWRDKHELIGEPNFFRSLEDSFYQLILSLQKIIV